MTDWGSLEPQHEVMLKEVLIVSGQAITEEQAWALCYQCSSKLQQILQVSELLPVLSGVESVLILRDGAVTFAPSAGTPGTLQVEEKVIAQLGKLVYTALDWGFSHDVERVLSDSLLYLLLRMLGLDSNCTSPTKERCKVTLNEVIKVCMERIFFPFEASGHYKSVLRMLYGVHAEICNLQRSIKQSKQNLLKLEYKDKNDSLVSENWSALWKCVMKELSSGMRLCCSRRRPYKARQIEYELAPYEMLMEDIRCKRYTLRKIQDSDQSKLSKSEENDMILDLIRSLKPASARKLREKPQEEPSLHELLMSEIKSSRSILKSTADGRKYIQRVSFDEELRITEDVCSIPQDYPYYRCQLESRWNLPTFDFPDNPIEARISWNTQLSQESSSEQKLSDLTSSSTDLSFLPVWTSSQVDLRTTCSSDLLTTCSLTQEKFTLSRVNQKKLALGHKRSSSYEGFIQGSTQDEQDWDSPRVSLPPTVLELAPLCRMKLKTEASVFLSSRDFLGDKQACSSCRKRLLCWQVFCKFCERTICPECRVEMLMPHRKCMHLPVSFFKALVLTQSDLARAKELLHWNNSSVPLVMFHPKNISGNLSFRKWIMYNWTSVPICLTCQEYILDVVKRNSHCDVPSGILKSRSMSVSATPFMRH